jgi:hypothetical protein
VLPRTTNVTEAAQAPPARRPRVVSPSLRNLVLSRTPSPPPRSSLQLTTPSPVIDHRRDHATIPAQRTPSRHATPASSPLPPSSPFAEEADCDNSQPMTFYSVPCPKPKSEPFQACTPSDEFEADKGAPAWSHDDGPKEECDHSLLGGHAVLRAPLVSLVTAVAPYERHLAHKRHPSLPPVDAESSTALSPKAVDEREIQLPTPDDPNGAWQLHGSCPESTTSAAPSPPAQLLVPLENPPLDVADQDPPAISSSYSRAASSALTALTALDDEHSSAPPSPPRAGYPASSPLSSPPSSPSPDQRREIEAPSPTSSATGAGTKRHAPTPSLESDPDVASISASAPPERAPTRTKRRRRHMDSDDDMSQRDWKNPSRSSAPSQRQPPILAPTHTPIPASPPRASCSSTTTSPITTAAPSPSSPTFDFDRKPHDADANDDKNADGIYDNDGVDDDNEEHQSCPNPALLGILIEALALSRASSLPLSTLSRTNPALAGYPHAVIMSTLTWAVHSRILGCVRSSGEALPPSYFYDPATDPDRERGELLRCLMPRAGKRRETMKYKQYYWAPVVVGRGRTRTWDVDWEE